MISSSSLASIFPARSAIGAAVVNFNNNNPFTAYGQSLERLQHRCRMEIDHRHVAGDGTGRRHSHAGRADPDRHFRGDSATFFAGGQFPVLNGFSCNAPTSTPGVAGPSICQPSIQFKNFGVALNFMPVVLSGGRISLNVTTDVSDLTTTNARKYSHSRIERQRDRAIDPRAQRQHHGRNSLRWCAGAWPA